MDSPSPSPCCAGRPDRLRGVAIREIPDLAALAVPVKCEAGAPVHYYACRACGQSWEEHRVPMMHAEITVLVKAGVPAEEERPIPPAPLPTPSAPSGDRTMFWIVVVTLAAIILLSRLSK